MFIGYVNKQITRHLEKIIQFKHDFTTYLDKYTN